VSERKRSDGASRTTWMNWWHWQHPWSKKGGLLRTTTSSAGTPPLKFVRVCKEGLDKVGLQNAKLERIQPMPVDFPSIGPQPVKNFVWRMSSLIQDLPYRSLSIIGAIRMLNNTANMRIPRASSAKNSRLLLLLAVSGCWRLLAVVIGGGVVVVIA
jgi:hypothetical protein